MTTAEIMEFRPARAAIASREDLETTIRWVREQLVISLSCRQRLPARRERKEDLLVPQEEG